MLITKKFFSAPSFEVLDLEIDLVLCSDGDGDVELCSEDCEETDDDFEAE